MMLILIVACTLSLSSWELRVHVAVFKNRLDSEWLERGEAVCRFLAGVMPQTLEFRCQCATQNVEFEFVKENKTPA